MSKKRFVFLAVLASLALVSGLPVHAQLGWSVTFDPTQSAHAISEIAQLEKTYTTTHQTYQNVVGAYKFIAFT